MFSRMIGENGVVRRCVRAVAGLVFLLLAACSDSGPSGPESFVIVENNSTAYTVTDVYIRESGATASWGINQLNSDVGPGEYRTVSFEPDTYDFRIEADHPRSPLELLAVAVPVDMALLVEVTDADMVAY